MQAIEDTLYDAFGQRQITTIYAQVNQYRVVLGWAESHAGRPTPIGCRPCAGARRRRAQVPLTAFATFTRASTAPPLVITRQAQFPSVTLSLQPRRRRLARRSGECDRRRRGARSACPRPFPAAISGDAAEFQSSLASEPWLILAAVVVIYIVLGVLYESTIHPVTILSTLPSAGIGALLALMVGGVGPVAGGAGRASCC